MQETEFHSGNITIQTSYRYEWVDVGMLDYDPATKLYLVKRVSIPEELLDCEREKLSRQSLRSSASARTHSGRGLEIHSSLTKKPISGLKLSGSEPESIERPDSAITGSKSEVDDSGLKSMTGSKREVGDSGLKSKTGSKCEVDDSGLKSKSGSKPDTKSGEEALPAIDVADAAGHSPPRLGGQSPDPGKEAEISLARGVVKKKKRRKLKADGKTTFWVPRVRLMFAAEDPRVFANRVAYAHMTRYVLDGWW